jgi:hypothetical protein
MLKMESATQGNIVNNQQFLYQVTMLLLLLFILFFNYLITSALDQSLS